MKDVCLSVLPSVGPSVCPSVRPSVKRVICDKTKESCTNILIPHEPVRVETTTFRIMNYSGNRNEVLALAEVLKPPNIQILILNIHNHVKRICYFELFTVYIKIILLLN